MNRSAVLWALGLLASGAARSAEARAVEAPPWLVEAAAIPTPADVGPAPALVLLHEEDVTLGADGLIHVIERRAVRVLARDGIAECVGAVPYRTDGGRVVDLRGWLIRASGEVDRIGKEQVSDLSASSEELYSDARMRVLDGREAAEPGVVFGWEGTRDEPIPFTTFHWSFQEDIPVARSRFSLTLPSGCTSKAWTFNHSTIESATSGSRATWELRDLPAIEEEPYRPPASSLGARLAVSVALQGTGPARSFVTWGDVARWLEELTASSAEPSPEVAKRAAALVAGARTRVDSVRAIARYVQEIRYASILMGLASGSGYRPHRPHEVLSRSYGDCKDKSNLMRSMLRAVGVGSHLVVASAFDPDYVREEWPTPQQFNHCIIGVELGAAPAGDAAGAAADGPNGRLIFFDPTASHTRFGDLPRSEQGGAVLVVSNDSRKLTRLPELPPELSVLERLTDVEIGADGSVMGMLRERSVGQEAALERSYYRGSSRDDYRRMVERWIGAGMGGIRLSALDAVDDSAGGRFALEVRFQAPRYGQLVQDRLMLFRPAMVSRRAGSAEKAGPRRYPVAIEASATRESTLVKLPEGFAVDELPQAVEIASPYGRYSASCQARGNTLVYTRSLTVKRTRAPADQYPEVRKFFERIRAAEQNPVVLARR